MTVNITPLVNYINNAVTQEISDPLLILQLSSIVKDSITDQFSYPDVASLPLASENKGRLVYVESTCSYRISDGTSWTSNFTPPPPPPPPVPEGNIYGFGSNINGQLGDNTVITKSSPVSVVGGFTDWLQVSAGTCHSLGIRADGTAWGWGGNVCGRLGSGSVTLTSSPVSVVGGFTDWCQVSAGGNHSVGIRTNGTAWAWGQGLCGRLGDGTVANKSSPVQVVLGFNWCQVSAGECHSLGIQTNGTAWAWGLNLCGRLGDGTVTNASIPVNIPGSWKQVSAGTCHSLGIQTNGTAWGWGSNVCGRLGDGTTVNKCSPVSVVGGFTDWSHVSAGSCHSVGVRANGTAWAWGQGLCGKLGDGTVANKSSPVSVVGGFTDWCQISAGNNHSVGLRTDGTVWGWGCNTCAQLGDSTVVNNCSPVSVVGGFTNWCQVSAGGTHTIGVTTGI